MRQKTSCYQLTEAKSEIRSLLAQFADRLEYIDIRCEEAVYSSFAGSGGSIASAQCVTSEEFGYAVRVQQQGVWYSMCTTDEAELELFLTDIASRETGSHPAGTSAKLSPVEHADSYQSLVDFRERGTPERNRQTLQDIVDYAGSIGVGVASFRFFDRSKQLLFLNTEGSSIYQVQNNANVYLECFLQSAPETSAMLPISASEAGCVLKRETLQPMLDRVRGQLEDLQQEVEKPSGIYDVVLCPALAGTLFHEAVGHPSEADTYDPNVFQIGEQIGPEFLHVWDKPLESEGYRFDDEGVPVRERLLIEGGRFVNLLHARTTASDSHSLSGNGRAVSYRFAPICRMRQTTVQPGTATFEKLLDVLGNGLYLVGYLGGSTYGDSFLMTSAYGYVVQDGKLQGAFPGVSIVGNIREALAGIEMMAADDTLTRDAGGCDKAGQNALPNEMRAPSILVRGMQIGEFPYVE